MDDESLNFNGTNTLNLEYQYVVITRKEKIENISIT